MKKLLLFIAISISFALPATAQPTPSQVTRRIIRLASDAAAGTCNAARKGYIYFNTTSNTFRSCNGTAWAGVGNLGDVVGPASSTDNAITRFDGTGGKTLQDSSATVSDTGSVNVPDEQGYQIAGTVFLRYVSATGTATIGNAGMARVDVSTSTNLYVNVNNGLEHLMTNAEFMTDLDNQIGWGDVGVTGVDTGFRRIQAGIVGTTNGTAVTGVSPGVQLIVNSSDTTLNSDANAQSVFAAANDTLTVVASTTYFFEAQYFLTTGTTTHTTATLFGGTASLTSIGYWSELWSVTDGTISTTAPSVLRVAVGTSTVLNATSTAAGTTIRLSGVIRVNGAGTLIPQIQFSANPTGTNLGKTNSYFKIWPAGTNTVTSVGPWN